MQYLLEIQYGEEYKGLLDRLRNALALQDFSVSHLDLLETFLVWNPTFYTGWIFRCEILERHGTESILEYERQWVRKMCLDNPKSYQVWNHRQNVIGMLKCMDFTDELNDLNLSLYKDSKNYHAWSYRVWLAETYGLASGEMEFSEELIRDDPWNNSAWNYRWFMWCKILENFDEDHTSEDRRKLIENEFIFTECFLCDTKNCALEAYREALHALLPSCE